MTKLLALFDIVPGWCWAAAVAVLAVLCMRLDAGQAHARADLLAVQLAMRDAAIASQAKAQARADHLSTVAQEAQDALSQMQATAPARAAGLTERVRDIARPLRCAPAGAVAAAPSSPYGQPDPGLSGVAGAGVVVLDATAQSELAQLVTSAADTGQALTQARVLLRECWRAR
jgi:hypothetical protein